MRLLAAAIGRFPGDHRRIPNLTRHPLIGMSGHSSVHTRRLCVCPPLPRYQPTEVMAALVTILVAFAHDRP